MSNSVKETIKKAKSPEGGIRSIVLDKVSRDTTSKFVAKIENIGDDAIATLKDATVISNLLNAPDHIFYVEVDGQEDLVEKHGFTKPRVELKKKFKPMYEAFTKLFDEALEKEDSTEETWDKLNAKTKELKKLITQCNEHFKTPKKNG